MKKYLLLVLLAIVATVVHAQRFEGGLVGGLNASQVRGDYTHGYHKPGIQLGAYVQTDLSPRVYAGMEIKYSQKGSRKNPDPKTGDQEKYIMRLGYIDMPVYLGVRTVDAVSIIFGLSPGYLMRSSERNNYGLFPPQDRKPFKQFDLEGIVGARYPLTRHLKMEVRLGYSVIPIRDNPGDVPVVYWLNSQFNNVLSTSIYYSFGK